MKRDEVTAVRKRIAERLKELRLDAGLRQADLAEKLGEPQSYVSRYESGEQRLDLIELSAVCRALNFQLSRLISEFERHL